MQRTKQENKQLLEELLNEANQFQNSSADSPEFEEWKERVERSLIKIYGNNSKQLEKFNQLSFGNPIVPIVTPEHDPYEDMEQLRRDQKHEEYFREDFDDLIQFLRTWVQEIDE